MIQEKGIKIKIVSVLIFFILCGTGIIIKLYLLQVKNHQQLDEKALNQYKGRFFEYSNRGNIFDRNMRELAINVRVKSVYANPDKIQNRELTVRKVSSILGLSKKEVRKKLKQKKSFVYIKRKITPAEYKKLKQKKLPGIQFTTEYKRFYPKMELTARTIGFAGIDNQGLSGIEYSFDDYLSEGGNWVRYQKDRRGRSVELVRDDSAFFPEGSDLVLTIDEVLQYYASKAIQEKVIQTGAKRGLSIIMQPNTGEILALAEYPSYNANLHQKYSAQQSKNWGISDSFEPGSTFKIFLASAALEEKIVQPQDIFFCENGVFDIGGIVIHEANGKKYRWLTFTEIISKSSNIGAVKIGRRLGKEKFYKYIKKFGFGEKTGIDLPGEAAGLVREPSKWSTVSLGSISMGQEISLTPLQLAVAVSAIGNGGNLVKPLIVKQVIHNSRVVKNISLKIVRKVLSSETVKTMKEILAHIVEYGTGKKAAIAGYTVGGKTGTAQKIDPATKKYSSEKYVASFVGFVPIENPEITIVVIIDEPQGVYWGGSVAAPVFREIGEKALRYLKIPSKMNRVYSVPVNAYNGMQRKLNTEFEFHSVSNENNSNQHQGVDKVLDRLIAGLKKYYWEADKLVIGY